MSAGTAERPSHTCSISDYGVHRSEAVSEVAGSIFNFEQLER
jgi:hypothetical protein